jgi:hypothetical protein
MLVLSMLVSKSSTVFLVENHTLTPIILGKINMNASKEIVFPFCHIIIYFRIHLIQIQVANLQAYSLTKAIIDYVFTVGIMVRSDN